MKTVITTCIGIALLWAFISHQAKRLNEVAQNQARAAAEQAKRAELAAREKKKNDDAQHLHDEIQATLKRAATERQAQGEKN